MPPKALTVAYNVVGVSPRAWMGAVGRDGAGRWERGMQQSEQNHPSAETLVRTMVADRAPREAAVALTELATRTLAELQKLARAEAEARRGQPDWGRWAKLANAARGAVLQGASCRDAARGLGPEE